MPIVGRRQWLAVLTVDLAWDMPSSGGQEWAQSHYVRSWAAPEDMLIGARLRSATRTGPQSPCSTGPALQWSQ